MKERAGIVGAVGLMPLIAKLRNANPNVRIHLVGHSFGGRLVTSAANALPGRTWGQEASSMTLLQAAFSHFGLASNYAQTGLNGAFQAVVSDPNVAGEIAITFTKADEAVGLAYPLASRLFNQVASAIGDPTDLYGGIGRNGALSTPEAVMDQLRPAGHAYTALPAGRRVRNLLADGIIHDHGDVKGVEVAYVVMRNALLSPPPVG
jgi:pimeloyl-ACP methyl ester carboxylesterase